VYATRNAERVVVEHRGISSGVKAIYRSGTLCDAVDSRATQSHWLSGAGLRAFGISPSESRDQLVSCENGNLSSSTPPISPEPPISTSAYCNCVTPIEITNVRILTKGKMSYLSS
jgi:hypothetical protein